MKILLCNLSYKAFDFFFFFIYKFNQQNVILGRFEILQKFLTSIQKSDQKLSTIANTSKVYSLFVCNLNFCIASQTFAFENNFE
jgi:hypothetical protein